MARAAGESIVTLACCVRARVAGAVTGDGGRSTELKWPEPRRRRGGTMQVHWGRGWSWLVGGARRGGVSWGAGVRVGWKACLDWRRVSVAVGGVGS